MQAIRYVAVVVVLAALAGLVLADGHDDGPRAQGKPKSYEVGKSVRYAVWHDGDGWHLRTTTAKRQHRFKGSVSIDEGEFVGATGIKLESGESSDHFKVGEKKHHIAFDFQTEAGEDGFDFRASDGAKGIHWTLEVGPPGDKDTHADVLVIYIGEDGVHPGKVPFRTYAHPVKQSNDKKDKK